MNIIELQDNLKNFSQDQLIKEMQMPSGQVPQFLVLGELDRRKKMMAEMQAQTECFREDSKRCCRVPSST
jgi:hypothetical protein